MIFITPANAILSRFLRSSWENGGKFGKIELLYPRQEKGIFSFVSSAIFWASLIIRTNSTWAGNDPNSFSSSSSSDASLAPAEVGPDDADPDVDDDDPDPDVDDDDPDTDLEEADPDTDLEDDDPDPGVVDDDLDPDVDDDDLDPDVDDDDPDPCVDALLVGAIISWW